jgi:hypothetical protein
MNSGKKHRELQHVMTDKITLVNTIQLHEHLSHWTKTEYIKMKPSRLKGDRTVSAVFSMVQGANHLQYEHFYNFVNKQDTAQTTEIGAPDLTEVFHFFQNTAFITSNAHWQDLAIGHADENKQLDYDTFLTPAIYIITSTN